MSRLQHSGPPHCELDHVLIGASSLNAAMAYLQTSANIAAEPGGSHPDRGTSNALIATKNQSYIEFLAPEPSQAHLSAVPKFLQNLAKPAFCWWCLRTESLEALQSVLPAAGIDSGPIIRGSRIDHAGRVLHWRLLLPDDPELGSALPFFIEWDNDTEHPGNSQNVQDEITQISFSLSNALRLQELLVSVGFHDPRVTVTEDELADQRLDLRLAGEEMTFCAPEHPAPTLR